MRLPYDDTKITSFLILLLRKIITAGLMAGIWKYGESRRSHNEVSATPANALIGSRYQTATN